MTDGHRHRLRLREEAPTCSTHPPCPPKHPRTKHTHRLRLLTRLSKTQDSSSDFELPQNIYQALFSFPFHSLIIVLHFHTKHSQPHNLCTPVAVASPLGEHKDEREVACYLPAHVEHYSLLWFMIVLVLSDISILMSNLTSLGSVRL